MKITALALLALAGAAAGGLVAHANPSKATIRVTEREYSIRLSARRAIAGPVRLEVRNAGKVAHALAVSGAGVDAKTHVIQPGGTAVLDVVLERGVYALWCPVPGHAARGMKATLATPGPPPAGTTTTNDTTTADSGGGGYGY